MSEYIRLVCLLRSLEILPDLFGLVKFAVFNEFEKSVAGGCFVKDQHRGGKREGRCNFAWTASFFSRPADQATRTHTSWWKETKLGYVASDLSLIFYKKEYKSAYLVYSICFLYPALLTMHLSKYIVYSLLSSFPIAAYSSRKMVLTLPNMRSKV